MTLVTAGDGAGDAWGRPQGDRSDPSTSFTSAPADKFVLDPFYRSNVARGLGHVVGLASSASSLWVATSKNYLIRYDELSGKVQERKLNCVTVKKLFAVDESHLLVTVHDGKNLETLCVKTEEMLTGRPVVVKGLQGRYLTSAARCGKHTVVGSDTGILYGSSSPSGPFVKLMEIPQRHKRRSPVSGLASIEHDGALVLLALCGACVQCFTLPSRDAWFEDGGVQVRPVELPIEQDAAQLVGGGAFWGGSGSGTGRDSGAVAGIHDDSRCRDLRVAVLSTSGVFVGEFPGLETLRAEPIPFSCGPGDALPMSMAMTRYHIVLLYPTKVQFVNAVSREVVQEVAVEGSVLGLSRDLVGGRLFLLAGDDVHEIDYSDEDRDMWRVYLGRRMYDRALPLCRTAEQRDVVYLEQAEALFDQGAYEASARLFGRITASLPSLDEVACRFLGLDGPESSRRALEPAVKPGAKSMRPIRAFLESKLSTLSTQDFVKRTAVSKWLLELLMHSGADAGAEDGHDGDVVAEFVAEHADCLHPRTTASILESHGRTNALLAFFRARKDDGAELELLMSAGETAQAIGVLRKPGTSLALVYKYATTMMAREPTETVSLWMDILRARQDADVGDRHQGFGAAKSMMAAMAAAAVPSASTSRLDPLALLPAIASYAHPGARRDVRSEIIRFVNFAIDLEQLERYQVAHDAGDVDTMDTMDDTDDRLTALFELNISLLSADEDNEDLLVEKIAAHRTRYDPVRALRLCSERGRTRAAIALLVDMRSWKDAVDRSLGLGDIALARSIACQCEDGDLRKQLFLDIIETRLAVSGDDQNAVDDITCMISESDCVSVDDILTLFPADVRIGTFKGLIRTSLRASAAVRNEKRFQMKQAAAALRGVARLETNHLDLAPPAGHGDEPLMFGDRLVDLVRKPFVDWSTELGDDLTV